MYHGTPYDYENEEDDINEEYCQIARQRLEAVDTGVPVKEQKKGQLALYPV